MRWIFEGLKESYKQLFWRWWNLVTFFLIIWLQVLLDNGTSSIFMSSNKTNPMKRRKKLRIRLAQQVSVWRLFRASPVQIPVLKTFLAGYRTPSRPVVWVGGRHQCSIVFGWHPIINKKTQDVKKTDWIERKLLFLQIVFRRNRTRHRRLRLKRMSWSLELLLIVFSLFSSAVSRLNVTLSWIPDLSSLWSFRSC